MSMVKVEIAGKVIPFIFTQGPRAISYGKDFYAHVWNNVVIPTQKNAVRVSDQFALILVEPTFLEKGYLSLVEAPVVEEQFGAEEFVKVPATVSFS